MRHLGKNLLAASFAGLMMFILPKRRRHYSRFAFRAVTFATLLLTIACGGKSSSQSSQHTLISTSTALSVTPAAPVLGAATVFTAKVTPISGIGVPTGSITFSAGSAGLGTSPLAGKSATFTSTSLPLGSQAVIATYSGDSTYGISSSAVTLLDVSSNVTLTISASDPIGNQSSAKLAEPIH
jgi:Bacterial Ig-like domain (group 3)